MSTTMADLIAAAATPGSSRQPTDSGETASEPGPADTSADTTAAPAAREGELLAIIADLRAIIEERWSDTSLLRTGPEEDGFRALLRTPFGNLLAGYCAEVLRREAAVNFVAVEADHPEDGPLTFTVQRRNGHGPVEQLAAARRERDVLRVERDAALAQVALMRAILTDAARQAGSTLPGT